MLGWKMNGKWKSMIQEDGIDGWTFKNKKDRITSSNTPTQGGAKWSITELIIIFHKKCALCPKIPQKSLKFIFYPPYSFVTDLTVSSLGMVHITIPNAIQSGRNAILMCDYELEGDDLYSVKWYKGMSKLLCNIFIVSWKNFLPFFHFFIPQFIHDRQERVFSIHSKGNSFNKNISFSWYTGRCKLFFLFFIKALFVIITSFFTELTKIFVLFFIHGSVLQ